MMKHYMIPTENGTIDTIILNGYVRRFHIESNGENIMVLKGIHFLIGDTEDPKDEIVAMAEMMGFEPGYVIANAMTLTDYTVAKPKFARLKNLRDILNTLADEDPMHEAFWNAGWDFDSNDPELWEIANENGLYEYYMQTFAETMLNCGKED